MRGATSCHVAGQRPVQDFNPRSPCGERLYQFANNRRIRNFNPRSPCGERPIPKLCPVVSVISIHAPHAGSDHDNQHRRRQAAYFNPRSPCGERRRFLDDGRRSRDFNPRSPCGERPLVALFANVDRISIHAPHAGSDLWR